MAGSEAPTGPRGFFWYDLETTGTHWSSDRILQVAGQRTDADLRTTGEPFATYVQLAEDVVPRAEACLITGITPQRALAEGGHEWRVLRDLDAHLRTPGTCIAGFNNIRFDDEFLRHGLYRNLMDPYEWHWKDGNSRWDLIDFARAACALRPDGVRWPEEDGVPLFTLQALCGANGIDHTRRPHDALADVEATLALARLLKARKANLWNWAVGHRSKESAERLLLNIYGEPSGKVLIHVSRYFARERYCAAPVVALARHPEIGSRAIVADLAQDVSPLIECDAEELRERLFSGESEAPRPPLTEVALNQCPFLASIKVVRSAEEAARLGFSLDDANRRRDQLAREQPGLAAKLADVYRREPRGEEDPELSLYAGFLNDADRSAMRRLGSILDRGEPWPPGSDVAFKDKRLKVLAERLKARLRPQELDVEETHRWQRHVRTCLSEGFGGRQSLADYHREVQELAQAETDPRRQRTLAELAAFKPRMP